jgi:hypothetical protein
MRLSLPRATPKLSVNCSPRLTISVRLCQTLNLSSMFVSLSIEENPKIIISHFIDIRVIIRDNYI